MLAHFPILSALIWLPEFGAVLVLLVNRWRGANPARITALVITTCLLLLCVPLYTHFQTATYAMQFREHARWIPSFQMVYDVGVDGISLPLVILSCFTTLLVILASWSTVKFKVGQYLATFLVMQGMMVGVFCALDSILFYFFWEAMLIPMYLSIGIWGGERRTYAAIKFFLYTFLGSALMLIALLYLHQRAHSFYILDFYHLTLPLWIQSLVFLGFLLAFAVKIPMWPVHTWLPDAHTEAPAGGSVILAALMLKMGAYGFLRFSLPIAPNASHHWAPMMIVLSLVAIIYIGYIAYAQTDMKRLIAYSSVAHMGFVTLGCFLIYTIIANTGSTQDAYLSIEGAVIQMVNHAFGSGALFLAFGLMYEQMHTRRIEAFGGVANTAPVLTAFFILFAMSNVGLPFTAGFVGEFMVILSAFKVSLWAASVAAVTVIIGAVYTLWMVRRVFFGPVASEAVAQLQDVRGYDLVMFLLLALVVVGFGVYPYPVLNLMHASVGHILNLAIANHLPMT